MGIAKLSINGSSFIGAFCIATDAFSIIGRNATHGQISTIKETLGVEAVPTTIDGSELVGIYAVANSKNLLLPEMTTPGEIEHLKAQLHGIEIKTMETNLNALGNNILTNDKIAIVNAEYGTREINDIETALGVEVIKLSAGGFYTVGASNILTNNGIVLNNRASDSDVDAVKAFFKNYSQSTANLGALSIRLSAIANSKGLLVGTDTTGFEMARIAEGLGL